MTDVSDEELARRLQAEIDSDYANIQQGNAKIAALDEELAKRLQEEADLEAQFDVANAAMDARMAEAVAKKESGGPVEDPRAPKS